jgi:RNA polymerase sigma-70 factor (ECF subfamily)
MSAIFREFQANKAALRSYLSRYFRRAQDLDDLLHEVFLRAYAAEAQRPILMPKAYLFRTAKHLALNELARGRTAQTGAMEDFDNPDVLGSDMQPSVEQEVEGRRRLALFGRAVAALPEQCRKVLVLKKVEGLSQQEIARRLGIAESTVEKHLAKGLLLTRDYMARAENTGGAIPLSPPRRKSGEAE